MFVILLQFRRWFGFQTSWWEPRLARTWRSIATRRHTRAQSATGCTTTWCCCPRRSTALTRTKTATGLTWNSPCATFSPETSATIDASRRTPSGRRKAPSGSTVNKISPTLFEINLSSPWRLWHCHGAVNKLAAHTLWAFFLTRTELLPYLAPLFSSKPTHNHNRTTKHNR